MWSLLPVIRALKAEARGWPQVRGHFLDYIVNSKTAKTLEGDREVRFGKFGLPVSAAVAKTSDPH